MPDLPAAESRSFQEVAAGPSRRRASLIASIPVAVLVALFLAQGLHGLAVNSGTCDELGAHVPAGILFWKSGRFSGGAANPPLGQLLAGAGPVLIGTANHPLDDSPGHMLPARIPALALGVVSILVAGRMGRHLGGRAAGIAALGAAALSPNLIAHAGLATLDAPSAAFFALALLLAWEHSRSGSLPTLAGFAFATGAAVLVKLTALHLLPAVALGAMLAGGSPAEKAARGARLFVAGIVGIVAVAWATCGVGEPAGPLPAGLVEAFRTKWEHGRGGHFTYLFGQRGTTGFPHYFAVALAVKTPAVTLLAAGVGVLALLRNRLPGDSRGFAAFVLVPAVWYFAAISVIHRVDIGVRHALPVLPALHVLAGAGAAWLLARPGAARLAGAALGVGLFATAVTTSPDHLAYFNRLSGGPFHGDRILIDSNLDWGQDEGRFRSHIAGEDRISVNPRGPADGRVAVGVNARHGILSNDDSRLGWVGLLEPSERVGASWRIYDVTESKMRAAATDPARSLRVAEWLAGTGRGEEALHLLGAGEPEREADVVRWHCARAEAALVTGDLELARRSATAAGDPDLAARVAYRTAAAQEIAWMDAAGDRWIRLLPALVRRGKTAEADSVCRAATGLGMHELVRRASGTSGASEGARHLDLARRYRAFGMEKDALIEAALALAAAPDSEDALWLYGEMVVRRKLGLTEYPLPEVDWSGVGR